MTTHLKSLLILVMLFGLFKCKDNKPKDELLDKFETELKRQHLKIDSVDNEGLYIIDIGSTFLKVSLENLRRNYAVNKDTTLISDFVASLKSTSEDIPDWDAAKESLYYSFFPSDFDFNAVLNQPMTKDFNKVYIYSTKINNTWITKADFSKWNISKDDFEKQVLANVNKLMHNAEIHYDTIQGKKLGYISIDDETLKGALLLSTELKNKVQKDFGWPIYAVLPVRDFCYIFSEKDSEFFIDRLGSAVVKEYKESSYPISTEILKISDNGLEAVGKFQTD